MSVIGQSHLLWRSRVPDHNYHSNTIVTEVVLCSIGYFVTLTIADTDMSTIFLTDETTFCGSFPALPCGIYGENSLFIHKNIVAPWNAFAQICNFQ